MNKLFAAIALLFLLAPSQAFAVYTCGNVQDTCQCGTDNTYPCCPNGGNCTWYAWHSACCNWGIGLPKWGDAKSWAGYAVSYPLVNVFNSPQPGCIGCRIAKIYPEDQWGHVAYVTQVNGGTITVNEMACYSYYGWKTKTYGATWFEKYICKAGAVEARCGDGACNGGENCSSCPQDCSCSGFCTGKASGAWCEGNNLVNCQGGQAASTKACPCGCKSMPIGVPDECSACGGGFCSGKMNGLWCDGDKLVNCSGGSATSSQTCPCGCKSMPVGTDDQCKECSGSGGGFCEGKMSGLWCDGNNLVNCSGGSIASTQSCPCGCQSNALGTNDSCKSCGGGFCDGKQNGPWCDGNNLVNCQGGAVASSQNCSCGCQSNPVGVADVCKPCGSGFCNGKMDGLWCDGDKLVRCSGGNAASSESCSCGCQSMPVGTNDLCKPCGSGFCNGKMNGLWCDGDKLVRCKDGNSSSSETCQCGCKSMPVGTNDECNGCGGSFCNGKMNGLWCDGDNLVMCKSNQVTSSSPCNCGCKSMPVGTNDECKACSGFCGDKKPGLWCDGDNLVKCETGAVKSSEKCACGCKAGEGGGPASCTVCAGGYCYGRADGVSCDGNRLVSCKAGEEEWVELCPQGCVVVEGQPPGCAAVDAATFCSTREDGTWCNGAFLVVCIGGKELSSTKCEFGCAPMPPGQPEDCAPPDEEGFCKARNDGFWCDKSVLMYCRDGEIADYFECPAGCEPDPEAKGDHCVPGADGVNGDSSVLGEDTAGNGDGIPFNLDDDTGSSKKHSSSCSMGGGQRSFGLWVLLMLAMAGIVARRRTAKKI